MSLKLKDKVAIVTGASKGMGASVAKHLAAETYFISGGMRSFFRFRKRCAVHKNDKIFYY